MKLKTKIKGPDYVSIASTLWDDVRKVNGACPGSDGSSYPCLSNGEVAAIILAWKRAAARTSVPTWPAWYELMLHALGWRQPGDRFVDFPGGEAKKYAAAQADPELIELTWKSVGELAGQIDAASGPVGPLLIDYSYQGYGQAARDTWQEMKRQNPEWISPIPPMPEDPPKPPIEPPHGGGGGGGGSWLLIALLIAAALGNRKRKD